MAGAGFLGGYAVGYAQHKPVTDTATPPTRSTDRPVNPTPTPTGIDRLSTPQCSFADFPFYPGSDTYHITPPMPNAWYVDQSTSQVASYFARGAYQETWTFVAGPSATVAPTGSVMSYKFRFTRAPACRGELTIFPETLQGASVYRMIPDAP